MSFINELRSAFQSISAEGYAEDTIEFGGHAIKIRTLSAYESSQVKMSAVEVDAELTRIEHYLHTLRIEAISRSIIALDGMQIPDLIDVDGERQEKHLVLRQLVAKWGDAVLSAIYRAYIDLEERTEARVRQKIRYQSPDYQASIDWHRQEIEKIEKSQKERERWLAAVTARETEAQEPQEPPPEGEEIPAPAPPPQAAPQGPPPVPPQAGSGRIRMDSAPPPPPARPAPDAPSIQLDDDTFLSADPDVLRAAIQREDERLRALRAQRLSGAMIATQAAAQPGPVPGVDGPLQRRGEALGLRSDDSDELRPQPVPAGGPGRVELNPQIGLEARNPRFLRRG